ncbi:T-cell immunoglobulin and mucin domain-containing protein 4-like isoform X1 [Thunnus albacares]|uniref:T-cell immunoglobulin and mucin domain-containing protein 4-like isoform X1 n=1 Tax=Thunnus albacares TaxID=8236 RepID=UPI001CF64BED|nr:T-cell immunoglobulin and mucin domain-containing protein 4-like isoform X1 [Thunnus albacares]XP_044226095.1 T-cell immunoglobulin and mucin domain-containing protein 4-like isoform X1 [Thunnus albacares]XP_044226096.1 T-cell immunoglobulin and mucin domain-containing protein 4-like isoform X1 [Thunnus albacares]
MLPLRLYSFTCVCVLTVPACVSAVTSETVVGVAGRSVTLPCRSEAMRQSGVGLCWGRGEPTLFTCRDILIKTAGDQVTYRKSDRYSVSSSPSDGVSYLSILNSQPSDSGFYHCRLERPGLFNDQILHVHLIIISRRSDVSDWPATQTYELSGDGDAEDLNAPPTTTAGSSRGDEPAERGSDVTGDDTTGPMVAPVQSPVQQVNSLQIFIGHTLRLSFIIFIPALMLTAAYRVWRTNQRAAADGKLNQSEEEDSSV